MSIYNWDKAGVIYDELAKRGIAIDRETEIMLLSNALTRYPSNSIDDEFKRYARIVFSTPDGPVIDPRPYIGAAKGVYYDERKKQWFARPYVRLPN
jgi:hypothetical protein